MSRRVPDQRATRLERRVQPLVGIEGERIRLFDPRNPVGVPGCDGDEGTDASVNMEPEILFAGESRKRRQVVDGARVDRARGRDHAAGRKSVRPVFRDGGAQRIDVHSQRAVCRSAPQRLIAEAECLHRLAMTGMNLVRSVEAQGLFDRCHTELAHVHTRLDVTCDRQADDVRHRAAADERAASGMRKADHGL